MARMGEHTRRLLDTLSSEWQELEDVFDGLIPTVPPGKALRKYETLRARQKPTGVYQKSELTDEEKIRSGARAILNDSVATLKTGEYVDIEGTGKHRRVRVRAAVQPGEACPTCGHVQEPRPFSEPSPKSSPRRTELAKVLPFRKPA